MDLVVQLARARTHTKEPSYKLFKLRKTVVFLGLKCLFFWPFSGSDVFRLVESLRQSRCLRVETFETRTKEQAALDSFV